MSTETSRTVRDWRPVATCPEGVAVWTLSPGGMEQQLVKRGRLFWAGEIYVYYTPTHWAPVEGTR